MTVARTTSMLFLVLAACGGDPDPVVVPPDDMMIPIDAPPAGPCWPFDTATPGGSIQLGTGDSFVAMPDEVKVHFGTQLGYDIPVNARVTGMVPGNPNDVLDPINPRTRFRAFFVDTGEPINPAVCPIRIAYEQKPSGDFDLSFASAVLFEVGLPEDQIFGRQVRVVVEIIDNNKLYATDEKVVTCRPPDQ
jgi:hypothetical protein